MIILNKDKLKTLVKNNFSYFEVYKEFEYLQSLDESVKDLKYIFHESYIGSFYNLDERTYDREERNKIVTDLLKEKRTDNLDLQSIEKSLFMLSNLEYSLLPKNLKYGRDIKLCLSDIYAFRNKNALVLKKNEITPDILIQLFTIPFLFSYMDLYMLPFKKQYFYYCNHHLDLFRIDFKLMDYNK